MIFESFVDGCSRGQAKDVLGEGAIGIVIYKGKKKIGEFARGLGKCTNNVSELEAILHCALIAWAAELDGIIIYSDSQLACKLINQEWETKQEHLQPLILSIRMIQEVFSFRVQQVPRDLVSEADQLANLFLDQLAESRSLD